VAEQELVVIDHRSKDHQIRDHTPKVSVFTDSANTPLTTAAVKRHRYVQNLKNNHQKLIEALSFVERFAVVCELSEDRLNAIRFAKDAAIEELTAKFQEKLNAYDARIKESQA
jgi:hypothetical protein